MLSSLGCLLLCGSIALALGNAQKLPKGKKPSLKVHINTTSDSILLKFLRPNPNVKLEGFLLGYGSNVSPNQYFPLPTEGKYTEAVVDAEPKYLIVVRPAPPPSQKKSCSGKSRSRKPLQLVVGTLTPSSVFLSWGFLINPHHDWTLPSHCPNDRFYTIRYREKDKEKKWIFQLCPATETIVENLKPNTVYEFGVKDNVEGGIWSKIFNHKTIIGSKNKVNGKIQSTYDQVHTVPAYVPKKLIPITIIKQVIQNVTHKASTKSPDKTPYGGPILVHLIIPGPNDTTVKLPTSIMFEISDAIKTQLAKNETLALPAESKTPEVEKIPAQPVTVIPEIVPRTIKPTVSSEVDVSETTLVLSERTPEALQTILMPKFELPLSTLAPKSLPDFPEAKTPFPFEKPRSTFASSEKPWMVPTAKPSEDSKVVQPQTATYDVFSSSTTSDETEISEAHTATSDPILDSVPPKTSRTLEQPRATLAASETPFVPQKMETFTSPEMQPTTPVPQRTTSTPSTPKRRPRPQTPRTKPAPEPQTPPTPQTTKAPPKTKRPGRRPRPKTTRRPDVPKSKPALEPATVQLELLVPTVAPKPTKRPKTTQRPDVPQIQPDSKPPKQLLPKPKTSAKPDISPTKSVLELDTVETEAPSSTIATTKDIEPVILKTEAPGTTLAPKKPQRARTRRPRPKHKTTPSPKIPQTKPDFGPVAPEPSLVPAMIHEPVVVRTEAPGTTLAPKTSKRTRRPRPKPKTTPSPKAPQTKPVPATDLEPGSLGTEASETIALATVLEPDTLRTKAPETTLAPKIQRTRRPRPRPKTTSSPAESQTKPVTAPGFETDIHSTKAPATTLAPTELQTLILKPVTSPSLEMTQSQLVSEVLESVTFSTESSKETIAPVKTDYIYPTTKSPFGTEESKPKSGKVVESITFVSEPPVTTLETSSLPSQTITPPSPDEPQTEPAPWQTPRAPPKPKTSPHPRIPQTQPVPKGPQRATSKPKMSPSPEALYTTPVLKDALLPHKPDPEVSQHESVLQPVTFRIEPPETTIAPLESRGIPFIPIISPSPSQEELQTTLEETDQTTQELFTTKIPRTTEWAKTTQAPHRLYTTPVRPRIPGKPHIRPVLNRTRPIRPKPSGIPSRNGVGTGTKQAPKPSGAGRNVSVDFTHSTKKPGTRHPAGPPRSGPPRRKPLPPNNVTGKPGSIGIISSGRVTSPPLRATLKPTGIPSERPETDKKQPTAPASGEELGNTTDISSSPTRETDHLGKPRFKGPHVRYIPKPDNRPCSITDSVKRFPTEEAMEGNATSPPQNPPTNLTVVTVEGCPSFVILDWEKPLNDTVTEYEVISRENGSFSGKNKSIQVTNQTFSTIENLKPDTSYEFQVKPKNPLGEGPASNTVAFSTESADPRVSEPVSAGRDAIWTERPFNSDSYSECKGKQYVKRTWYKKFVGVQLCNSLRYKIYLSDSLTGKFYNIGDQRGHGEDHCQFVDSFLDGRTGQQLTSDQLPTKEGYFRAVRQEPVQFGEIGGHTQITYVQWYECGTTIPGKW
ncbi:target of Nesh-SH3 isoform X23 [Marmota marmota marmota]|uniref:target of Nesh-SH3 isoform X23 n=1 Tax=Marmota marmota marmota TaxID=9994 RepID=UPI0020932F9D|nr:target of Nesh-SH3 isoform X23 [Marmota marmota marmota]